MRQLKFKAAFIRGGTSNAIVFNRADLPADESLWDEIFLAAMGSPDPYARQLNGMGGGISSLSKVCVVGPSSRPDADVDYTFAQIAVSAARVDYSGNCGNMSSAIGPFAIDEGLCAATGKQASVVIHNTNTHKLIRSTFATEDGQAAIDGDAVIPGVADPGASVDLAFLDPGGAGTGQLLPTGNVIDRLSYATADDQRSDIEVSMVDAANPLVFVRAGDMGIEGTELPEALDRDLDLMARLEAIRASAGVAMGIADSESEIREKFQSIPKIGIITAAKRSTTLSGETLEPSDGDLTARMVSMGNIHRALPLTGALGMAVAALIEGTIVNEAYRDGRSDVSNEATRSATMLRLMQPSGVIEAAAEVAQTDAGWQASSASVRRTQRRLFDGFVYVPAAKVSGRAQRDDGQIEHAYPTRATA